MKYRLGVDLGTNSIGWAAVQLNKNLQTTQLIDVGVRIFSDARDPNPKDKSSNAAQRRAPRAARRNRDRYIQRVDDLKKALQKHGLMPDQSSELKELEKKDPWILRYQAINEELAPFETGRAIFHLKRRGFKSNRKTDGEEAGSVYDGITAIKKRLSDNNSRTLGELFGGLRQAEQEKNNALPKGKRRPAPLVRVRSNKDGSNLVYNYYPQRALILDEFDRIWQFQAQYHPDIFSKTARLEIKDTLEFQRPLKPQKAGRCTFLSDLPRAPKALPSFQKFRMYQDINNLTVAETGKNGRALNEEERLILFEYLARPTNKKAERKFKAIKKELKIPESHRFNLETEKKVSLFGDETAARLMQPEAWGPSWFNLATEMQDKIVTLLLNEESETRLIDSLMNQFGQSEEAAFRIAKIRLPDGHGKLSSQAITLLLPHLIAGRLYHDAAGIEFVDHRALGDGEVHDELPYYGAVLDRHTAFEKDPPTKGEDNRTSEERYGKVANPTVHVALNELGKVINDLIKKYGKPEQIVLELARDLPLSAHGIKELERLQTKNQKANEKRRDQLSELGVSDNYENRLKLRLYEEYEKSVGLPVECVFSGQVISLSHLFSDGVEIEHILPISRSLDDSIANKILATRQANREKGNRSPFEAFSKNAKYSWQDISQRANNLPANKRWRFAEDAMDKFTDEAGFLDRQLNDTRYIARLGKTYVEALYGGQGSEGQERNVWVVPGRLTSDLRHYAGLNGLLGDDNKKTRTDHRHHAIDALVVALTDPSMIQRASKLAHQDSKIQTHEVLKAMAAPISRYRTSLDDRLKKLVVSHKPDHGHQGAMHNDTAFGITDERDARGNMKLVTRKQLSSFEKPADLDKIRDPLLRAKFAQQTAGLKGKEFNEALVSAGQAMSPKVHKVRIITPMKDNSFVEVQHGDGHRKAFKGDSNYCYDIWEGDKGKWQGEVVSTFEAYKRSQKDPYWFKTNTNRDGIPLKMRLRNGDMLFINMTGERRAVFVYMISNGQIAMAEHFEANASARVREKSLAAITKSPNTLRKLDAKMISVSPAGRVRIK